MQKQYVTEQTIERLKLDESDLKKFFEEFMSAQVGRPGISVHASRCPLAVARACMQLPAKCAGLGELGAAMPLCACRN